MRQTFLQTALLLVAMTGSVGAEDGGAPAQAPGYPGMLFLGLNDAGAETWVRTRDGATVIRVGRGVYAQRPYEGQGTTRKPRPVQVESFFLDRTEVTNEQFACFLNAQAETRTTAAYERALGRWLGPKPGDFVRRRGREPAWIPARGRSRHPVVNATGWGAQAFAAWVGGRLPTQTEWEKGAGGAEGRIYPWGAQKPDRERANFGRPKLRGTRPVGSYPAGAGPYGHVDMAGNAYDRVLMRTPAGEVLPVMLKGGSWLSPHPLNLRVLDLCVQPMGVAEGSVGFRIAMDDARPARPNRKDGKEAVLRLAVDFSDAVEEARERGVPIFLSLQYDTCGQCDRTRARLFRDPRFIAYCNEHLVVLVGHQPGDAGRDGHAANEDDSCPFYPGLECWQHYRIFQYGLQLVGEFTVSPGNFVLDPAHVWAARKSPPKRGEKHPVFLAPEQELPKWGGGAETYIAAFERARKQLTHRRQAGDAPRKGGSADAGGTKGTDK